MFSNHSPLPVDQPDFSALKGKLLLIGLTGGIGSGKTAASNLLSELGAGVIDTDLISHQITASGGSAIPEIKENFGSELIEADGAMNRAKMRNLVFDNPESRQILERIVHPLIRQEALKQALALAETKVPYLIVVVPLLMESDVWRKHFDLIVVVDCPVEVQIQRVMQRNKLSKAEVESILRAQTSREVRLEAADVIINNQGSVADLEPQILQLHQKLLKIHEDLIGSS
ncbi:dephospho-CoA kinase [Polynucleobacter meluiroseus]|uniref:Dephospho-CoA kinase n=1 Tax=Polynucleobacter meluiroseus TaxID=1938814 RepID=A0A240E0L0_9BURK|nr:dephospho-CoA kinase [Polynucleobacter meluiroseus]SNX28979.1 dephospho-CoA kinase [Polynucleobacter meluiroseus]